MNNKGIILLNNSNEGTEVKANGLAPIIGYEPWALRTIDSIKQTLCDNVPMLIRVHPAADYPCEDENGAYKLDMEAHAVLIIGYDDENRMFDVVNPWNKEWNGEYGGIEKISYDDIPITCVNSSYGKVTRLALPQKEVTSKIDDNGNVSVHLSVGYYTPSGYIIDEKLNRFTNVDLKVSYEIDGDTKEYCQNLKGSWPVGDLIETDIPLGKVDSEELNVKFELNLTLEGKRPYSYQDTIEVTFNEQIKIEDCIAVSEENNSVVELKMN